MKKFILILFITLLLGCKEDMSEVERFDVFIKEFLTIKEFELSRTSFPLPTYKHEFGINPDGTDDGEVVETIVLIKTAEKQPTLDMYMKKNGLTYTIEKQDNLDKRMIKVFKQGTDWLLHYHFEYKKSKWTLVFVHDYSL